MSLSLGQTVTDKDFGNQPTASVLDLSVSVAGGIARPGFQKFYGIRYDNLGTISIYSTVQFFLPLQVSFVDCSPGGTYNTSSHSVIWQLGNLPAGSLGWCWVKVQIPLLPIGSELYASVQIEPSFGDVNPFNNFDWETQIVQGSFDPNDKLVYPDGNITLNDTLSYTIRFQNTGNDTAFNVVIRDELDPDLDLSTVVPGASSHSYVFSIADPRELVFTFNNINLLDSVHNEPASHGFVKFKVRPLNNLGSGTAITNTAAIFFDYNPPVYTNTTTNYVMLPTIHDVGVTQILAPIDTIIAGAVVTPKAIVCNFGNQNQTSVPVYFTIGAYNSTRTVSLDAGATDTVEFDNWTAIAGNWSGIAFTVLGTDVNRSNDTAHISFNVIDTGVIDLSVVDILVPREPVVTCNNYEPAVLIYTSGISAPTPCSVLVRITRYPSRMISFCNVGVDSLYAIVEYEQWIMTSVNFGYDTIYLPSWHAYWWDVSPAYHKVYAEVRCLYDENPNNNSMLISLQ